MLNTMKQQHSICKGSLPDSFNSLPDFVSIKAEVSVNDPDITNNAVKKFSIDPKLTDIQVLRQILTIAFGTKCDFAINYLCVINGKRNYLPLKSNEDLLEAMVHYSYPWLILRVDKNSDLRNSCSSCLCGPSSGASGLAKLKCSFLDHEPLHAVCCESSRNKMVELSKAPSKKFCSLDERKLHCCLHSGKCPKKFEFLNDDEKRRRRSSVISAASIYSALFGGHDHHQQEKSDECNGSSDDEKLSTFLMDYPRPHRDEYAKTKSPLNKRRLSRMFDNKGRLLHSLRSFKLAIYQGGVEPEVRPFVWRLLLGVVDPYASGHTRINQMRLYVDQYKAMRDCVVRRFGNTAPNLDQQLCCVANMVRKDVVRTDRTLSYFSGHEDGNKNLIALFYILTTYALAHPDVGYCQGMSDLAAPILYVMKDECEAYVCFCALMLRMKRYFLSSTNRHIIQKFEHMNSLLAFYDPAFHKYLNATHSDPLLFCYRWFLLELKREFLFHDALLLMDVMWASVLSSSDFKYLGQLTKTSPTPLVVCNGWMKSYNASSLENARLTITGDDDTSRVTESKSRVDESDPLEATMAAYDFNGVVDAFSPTPLYDVALASSPNNINQVIVALSTPKLYCKRDNNRCDRFERDDFVCINAATSPRAIFDQSKSAQSNDAIGLRSPTVGQLIKVDRKPSVVSQMAFSCPDYILDRAVHKYLMESRSDESNDCLDFDDYDCAYDSIYVGQENDKPQKTSFLDHVPLKRSLNAINPCPSGISRRRHRSRSYPPKNRSILTPLKNLLFNDSKVAVISSRRSKTRFSCSKVTLPLLPHRRSSPKSIKNARTSRWSLSGLLMTSASSSVVDLDTLAVSHSLDDAATHRPAEKFNAEANRQAHLMCAKCSKKRVNFGITSFLGGCVNNQESVGVNRINKINKTIRDRREYSSVNCGESKRSDEIIKSNDRREMRNGAGRFLDNLLVNLRLAFLIAFSADNLTPIIWQLSSFYEHYRKTSSDFRKFRAGFVEGWKYKQLINIARRVLAGRPLRVVQPGNEILRKLSQNCNDFCSIGLKRSSLTGRSSAASSLEAGDPQSGNLSDQNIISNITRQSNSDENEDNDNLSPSSIYSGPLECCRCTDVDEDDQSPEGALTHGSDSSSMPSPFGECACGCDTKEENSDQPSTFDRFLAALFSTNNKTPSSLQNSPPSYSRQHSAGVETATVGDRNSASSFADVIETIVVRDRPNDVNASATASPETTGGVASQIDDEAAVPLAADATIEHFETLKRRLTLSRIHNLCISSSASSSKASSGISSMTTATRTTTAATLGGSTHGNISPEHDFDHENGHSPETETLTSNDATLRSLLDPLNEYTGENEETTFGFHLANRDSNLLPPPHVLGDGNPFMLFVSLVIIMDNSRKIMKQNMDYNEIAYYFDKMMRTHDVRKVLKKARILYANYLKSFNVLLDS